MKFVLNTHYLDAAASVVCIKSLSHLLASHGFEAAINDWEKYDRYDVAIFMGYDPEIEKAKQRNSNILVGLADPKPGSVASVKRADFLLVSSIEQREIFCRYNPNIFIYHMFPEFDSFFVKHTEKENIKIAYHGNKVHLNGFYNHLTPALNKLGERHKIELYAIYNIRAFGKWKIGRPDESKCRVHDLQWYENCYKDYFRDIDIGLAPNFCAGRRERWKRIIPDPIRYFFPVTAMDHQLHYKFSANPGRLFVFSEFKIPVVAEGSPSVCNMVHDDETGKIVLTSHGWYHALEDLIQDAEKRQRLADGLYEEVKRCYSREETFRKLILFLKNLKKKEVVVLPHHTPCFTLEMVRELLERLSRKWVKGG